MKKVVLIIISVMAFGFANAQAQSDELMLNDTVLTEDLLSEVTADQNEEVKLLPDHYLFTQRILWGEKGLMRNIGYFELTPEKRERELKIRRKMLVTHQVLGFVTLGGMIAQGFVGASLYNGNTNLLGAHEALAGGVNFCYFTTAALALFAPPKMLDDKKGYAGSIQLHKYLAIVHFASMIATNVLAGQLESNPDLRPYHRAAAYTAFGSFAAAMIVIKF